MKRIPRALILCAAALLPLAAAYADDEEIPEAQPGDLEQIQILKDPGIVSVNCVVMSPDGKFIYATAFSQGLIATFSRDAATGEIKLVNTINDPRVRTAIAIRLSRDGGYAVASCPGIPGIVVFKRDKDSGRLEMLTTARHGENGNDALMMVCDANFSPDNHFIYAAHYNGVGVYRFENERLSFVQSELAGGRLKAVRNATPSSDGFFVYAPGYASGTMAALEADPNEGKVKLKQLLADGEAGCDCLAGAFRVCCSPDGRNVYVSAGRFMGDQAVSVFTREPGGSLKLLEQHSEDHGTMEGFRGGNDIKVSPDGRLVYVLASLSDRLFRFQRDQETGALIPIGSQQVGIKNNPGAAGICFSPDSKFVYIADESSASIVVFKVP